MGPLTVAVASGSTTTVNIIRVAVVTSSCLRLAPSSAVIVPYVVVMFSPTSLPPWRVFQKNMPPTGQIGLYQGLTNQYPCTNMHRALQKCSMSAEPKKSPHKTPLPTLIYWESNARASALAGARNTSIQIQGILASVATLQINFRRSSFSKDSMRVEGAAAASKISADYRRRH